MKINEWIAEGQCLLNINCPDYKRDWKVNLKTLSRSNIEPENKNINENLKPAQ